MQRPWGRSRCQERKASETTVSQGRKKLQLTREVPWQGLHGGVSGRDPSSCLMGRGTTGDKEVLGHAVTLLVGEHCVQLSRRAVSPSLGLRIRGPQGRHGSPLEDIGVWGGQVA